MTPILLCVLVMNGYPMFTLRPATLLRFTLSRKKKQVQICRNSSSSMKVRFHVLNYVCDIKVKTFVI